MKFINWNALPPRYKINAIKPYYDILYRKRFSLFLKRLFDIVMSFIMLAVSSPLFLVFAVIIKLDSSGPVFFRQTRITQYGQNFRIFKFRTMFVSKDNNSEVTVLNDCRITGFGKFLRKYHLDEIPQLIDIFRGTMSFVGTRPEVPKYVEAYSPEMLATLLLPAGVTSLASIYYRNESNLISDSVDIDSLYINNILKEKMKYNLQSIKDFSLKNDFKILFMTLFAVFGKHYAEYPPIVNNTDQKELQTAGK